MPVQDNHPTRRFGGGFLASALLAAVFVLGALIPLAFFPDEGNGKQNRTIAAEQPANDSEALAIAQLDEFLNEQEKRASEPSESEVALPDTAPPVIPPKAAQPANEPEASPAATMSTEEAARIAKMMTSDSERKAYAGVRERWASKRRSRLTDEELRLQLLYAPPVALDGVPGTSARVISLSAKANRSGVDIVPQLSARRPDLMGLPMHAGGLARLSAEEALDLKVLSARLRLQIQSSMAGSLDGVIDPRPDPDNLREKLLNNPLQSSWLKPQAIATLRQLLMSEHRNVRMVLVQLLAKINGPIASRALAERALFDLDPEVRVAALVALKVRPSPEFESALVAGLRYPWPPVADHAAEALVALDLRTAVPKLIPLLDARELNDPYAVHVGDSKQAVVPEVVRINHLQNCLLCHPYSNSAADPVRGLAPNAEHLVPLPSTGTRIVTKGWGGGGGNKENTPKVAVSTFVRADINFLRQDFSVVQPVPDHGRQWPADQRFDYVVRLRPISPAGLLTWDDKRERKPVEPQRETLLFALRELTGTNPGPAAEDWKRLYSTITGQKFDKPLEPADQIAHLKECLLSVPASQQMDRLNAFKDKSGSSYDTALAQAIPSLSTDLQKTGRNILVDRLFCLPPKKLSDKLTDPDAEVRRAIITVAKQRQLKSLSPDLIARLEDPNAEVARHAHLVLENFAGRDFGPKPGADQAQRRDAIAAWQDWYDQRAEKRASARAPRQ
jgi:HEAT repeats